MANKFFKVENVSFSYYRRPLTLCSVNFSMEKNDKILIVANSEMGKTTFLKVMSSFENNYFGNISLFDKDLKTLSDDEKNFSLILTNPVLFENKTVLQNLNVISKDNSNEKELLIKKYNFGEVLNKKVKKITQFQKQKLALARSELKNPTIIFFDDQFQTVNFDDKNTFDELKGIYSNFIEDNSKSIIFAIDKKTFLVESALFDNSNIKKVLYLVNSNVFEFKNLNEFKNNFLNIDQLNFTENEFTKIKAILSKNADEYFISFDENQFFKISANHYNTFSKLNLNNNDDEDIILVFKDNIIKSEINEITINQKLNSFDLLIFSDVDGSRIL